MRTPMQELIEWIDTIISVLPDGSGAKNQMIIAKEKAESMLEKEKEVMCEFADDYQRNCFQKSSDDYYNETFNTKETCTCKSAQFTREVTEDFEPMCGRCGRPI